MTPRSETALTKCEEALKELKQVETTWSNRELAELLDLYFPQVRISKVEECKRQHSEDLTCEECFAELNTDDRPLCETCYNNRANEATETLEREIKELKEAQGQDQEAQGQNQEAQGQDQIAEEAQEQIAATA